MVLRHEFGLVGQGSVIFELSVHDAAAEPVGHDCSGLGDPNRFAFLHRVPFYEGAVLRVIEVGLCGAAMVFSRAIEEFAEIIDEYDAF